MDFVALDFETANEDLASICQIGLVRFCGGKIVDTYSTFVDPEDFFSSINTEIHGIRPSDVRGAPNFPEIYPDISTFINQSIVVSHTHFDRSAWNKTLERYALPMLDVTWLDSARVARRAWERYAKSGYGLSNIARDLGIVFQHHDALEDARAAGLILLKAIEETSISVNDWLLRVNRPIKPHTSTKRIKSIKREGNIEGFLYGETIAFTGTLSIARQDAADMAAQAGCNVSTGVTQKTTLLVVGDQDISALVPNENKSRKHVKAEKLISEGYSIRILQESDFKRLVASE